MSITPFGESYFNKKATFFNGLESETIKSGKITVDGQDNSISGVSTFSGTSVSVDNGYLNSLAVTGVSTFVGNVSIGSSLEVAENVSIGSSLYVVGNIVQDGNAIRGFQSYAIVRDVKGATTDGGSSIAGWNTRTWNDEIDPDGIVISAAGDRFRLEAGSYFIQWSTTGYRSRRFSSRLEDITNTVIFPGTSIYLDDLDSASNTIASGGISTGVARFTLTTFAFFRLYSYHELNIATAGLGVAHNATGYNNVYTHVTIFKELNVDT